MSHPRPWHKNSSFGPGRRISLDRNQRARFKFLIEAHHRARRITRAFRDIALRLLRHLSVEGRCDPSYDTLATGAACGRSTVADALPALRKLGLVTWERRIVRAGPRVAQTSNQYQLWPGDMTKAPDLPAFRSKSASRSQTLPVDESTGLTSVGSKKGGSGRWLWGRPEPVDPVRTAAEQIAILMACSNST